MDIGKSTAVLTLSIAAGTGGHTVNIATGTSSAKTINIGTGGATANTISIGSPSSSVAIGLASPNASAILHISSTTKGFLPPVMTTAQRDAISSPASGLVVFNSLSSTLQVYDGVAWRQVATSTDLELTYNEFTSNVATTMTTEASATVVVTASAYTFDGATPVLIEFFAPDVTVNNAAGAAARLSLFEDGSAIGKIAEINNPAAEAMGTPVRLIRRLTPTGGSHTYSIRAWGTGGTQTVVAGAGGAGNPMPGFIRITKAR